MLHLSRSTNITIYLFVVLCLRQYLIVSRLYYQRTKLFNLIKSSSILIFHVCIPYYVFAFCLGIARLFLFAPIHAFTLSHWGADSTRNGEHWLTRHFYSEPFPVDQWAVGNNRASICKQRCGKQESNRHRTMLRFALLFGHKLGDAGKNSHPSSWLSPWALVHQDHKTVERRP